LDKLKLLVEHGYDIHIEEDRILIEACSNGQLEVVKYLIKHGADVHAWGGDAFFWADRKGHKDVLECLKRQIRLERLKEHLD